MRLPQVFTSAAVRVRPSFTTLSHCGEGQIGRLHNGVGEATRVLVVEDDRRSTVPVPEYLTNQGFLVSTVTTMPRASAQLVARAFHLLILDLSAAREDGLDLLRAVRDCSDMPIVLVADSRGDEFDCVVGLELGADDFLVKPFSLRELLARIRALLRRFDKVRVNPAPETKNRQVHFDGWKLDLLTRRLLNPAGEMVSLTRSDLALLSAFVAAPGRPLSREFLIQVTRQHDDVFDRSIDVQVLRLRRKLETDPSVPLIIKTERGFGYRFALSVHR